MTINIEDIQDGDTVTIANASVGSLELPVEVPPATSHAKVTIPGFGTKCIHDIVKDGWTITDHKPEVELPTEPGVYARMTSAFWRPFVLDRSGSWYFAGRLVGRAEVMEPSFVGGPLVRLVPESDDRAKIAGEVLDWLAESSRIGPWTLDAARDHFGVDR